MPYPRSRSYATPEETFGITQKPLNAWFDAAASGMTRTGPAFSASFEDATLRNQQRELESERLRREMESEQAASAFLQRAAGEKPDALMQMIAEDPAILGSKDYGNIRDYVTTREQMQEKQQAQQPYSNQVLGPALMKQLEPEDQAVFAGFMEQGMEATEALQQVRKQKSDLVTQAERRKLALAAAEEGVDAADIAAAMASPDPDLYLAAAKGKAKRAGRGGSGDEYSLKDLIDIRKSSMDDFGEVVDPDLKAWVDEQIKFKTVGKPPAAITNAPATGAAKAPPAGEVQPAAPPTAQPLAAAKPKALTTFERGLEKKAQEAEAAKLTQQATANEDWSRLKSDLTMEFDRNNPEQFLNLAKAAVAGEKVDSDAANLLADFARAYAEGRQVQVGVRTAGNLKEGQYETPVMATPEEALLQEFGIDPDEIVGQAPTEAGGRKRNITALEAMRAKLDELAAPIKGQIASQKAEAKAAAQMTPAVQSSYEKLKAQAQGLTPTQP